MTHEIRRRIEEYVQRRGGVAYAPIPHPDFAHVPAVYGSERLDLILPHLPPAPATILDAGTHWGYTAHRLEEAGYTVTAVEYSRDHAGVCRSLRDAASRRFGLIEMPLTDLPLRWCDALLALNIFHHIPWPDLSRWLDGIDVKRVVFQGPEPALAYRVAERMGMTPRWIGRDGGRDIFRLDA